jgi:hypothetical protein
MKIYKKVLDEYFDVGNFAKLGTQNYSSAFIRWALCIWFQEFLMMPKIIATA